MRRTLVGALVAGALVFSFGSASAATAKTTKKKVAGKKAKKAKKRKKVVKKATTTTVKGTTTQAPLKTRVDRSFGANGVSLVPLSGTEGDRFSGITVAGDGRIYASGYVMRSFPARDQTLAVARITPRGTLDRGFGDNGVASVNLAVGATSTVERAPGGPTPTSSSSD